jgi:hypothetical protein
MAIRRVVDDDDEAAVLPPPMPAMYRQERTYPSLLGPLGGECSVSTECLFVDPVANIAVLGQPDNQKLAEEAGTYDKLVEDPEPLRIDGLPPPREHQLSGAIDARLLSLEGAWFSCRVSYQAGRALWISEAAEPIRGGMAGSPIVSEDGTAIGVMSVSAGGGNEGGPNPCLVHHLPGWLLRTA